MTSEAVRRDAGAAPRISVLVPCWNAVASIERGLRSVLDEAGPDLECIVVDDASTDGTPDLVARIAAQDERVVLIVQPVNGGVSEARNRGLAEVRGEWLTLLDADDRFLPGGLGALAAATADPAVRAVIGQQVWADGKRTWTHELYEIPDIRVPGRKSIAGSPGLLYYVSPHAKLLHRSTWEGLRFSGRVLGDQPWVIRALLRAGDGIEVLGETVYEWWRPPAKTHSSITGRTRSSADQGAAAAGVAATAFRAVADEAERRLPSRARNAVLRSYLERLIRSDLAFHLDKALRRRDPSLGVLLAAIAGFLRSVPPARARAGDVVARELLLPTLERFTSLDAAGRKGFWAVAVAALRNDPRAIEPLSPRRMRIAVRADRVMPEAARGVVAELVLSLSRRVSRVRKRLPG